MRKNIIQSKTEPNKNDIWLSEEGLKKYGKNGWEPLGGGGINDSTPVVTEVSGNELLPINVNGENKAVSAAALVKGAKEVYIVNVAEYKTKKDYENLRGALLEGKVLLLSPYGGTSQYLFPFFEGFTETNDILLTVNLFAYGAYFSAVTYKFSTTGSVSPYRAPVVLIEHGGDGTKFLSDDGTYKEVSSGSEPYIWDGTTSETKFAELKTAIKANKVIKYNLGGIYYLYAQEALATDERILLYFSQAGYRQVHMITTTDVNYFYVDSGKMILNDNSTLNPCRYNAFTVTQDTTVYISEADSQYIGYTLAVDYEGELTFGDTVYNVTFPTGIKWSTDSVLEYKPNYTYQFRILNNRGVMKEFANA